MVRKNWARARMAMVLVSAGGVAFLLVAQALKTPRAEPVPLLDDLRIIVAITTAIAVLLFAWFEVAYRRRQTTLRSELENQVEEQTSQLKSFVQELESANAEQAAQSEELAHYAEQIQHRQEELERALADAEIQTSLYAHASKRFESLFNGLPVGCATFSTDSEVMEWNTMMSTIARCAPHEALLRPVSHVFRGVREFDLAKAVEAALEKGEATSFESEWVRDGVDQTFVHISVFPMRQKTGEIVGGIMCVFDTTIATKASRAVAISESKLRAFIDYAPAAVAIFDREIKYLAASRRWFSDYNIEGQDVIGKSHYEVFPEIPEEWKEIHQRVLTGESISTPEERFDRNDGSSIWLQWEVRPWYDLDGAIGGIAMMTEDISERKAVMTQLYEAHEEVSAILESINDAFLSIDDDGVVVYINSSACQVLGTNKDAASSKSLQSFCPPALYTAINALCDQVRHLKTKQDLELEHQGSWFEFRVYPSGDGFSIFFQDISDRKTIQMQVDSLLVEMNYVNVKLENKQSELEEANKHLQALATTDGLTGLHNHRYFQDFLAARMTEAQADGSGLAVILMDVDKFKTFNDEFGHQAGDSVLIDVAKCLTKIVSEPHLAARYGGEEFVVIAVGVDEMQAWELAEKIRREIEAMAWTHRQVTASFGVSMFRPEDDKTRLVIERADQALYRSKADGRNRSTVFGAWEEAA